MLLVIWTDQAAADLESIADYVGERNLPAARRLVELIYSSAESLGERPYLYRSGREPGTREAVVHPNYIVVYRVEATAVRVLRILHASQQYP